MTTAAVTGGPGFIDGPPVEAPARCGTEVRRSVRGSGHTGALTKAGEESTIGDLTTVARTGRPALTRHKRALFLADQHFSVAMARQLPDWAPPTTLAEGFERVGASGEVRP
jgi:hypothetical protein